jgi:hypothetical protein
MPRSVLDLMSGWGTLLGRGPVNRVWKQVPLLFCGACGVREILGFLRIWRYRLGFFVEICLICYICGCRRIARVVCRLLIFYFIVRLFPLTMGTFVYFLYTRVAPLCAFY